MANMSYVAMENTYSDLADCVGILDQHVEDMTTLSESEAKFAQMLREECKKFIEALEMYDEEVAARLEMYDEEVAARKAGGE